MIKKGEGMKLGYEVEGKYIGIKSIFLDVSEMHRLDTVLNDHRVNQLYISDHENTLDLGKHSPLGKYLGEYVVTVERTITSKIVQDRINVMLVVDNPSFWDLRPNDQIKFTRNNHVYATTVRDMTETDPQEFLGDVHL